MQPGRLVHVVDVAYELEAAPEVWLSSLLEAAAPDLDKGMGVFAYWFDTRRPQAQWANDPVCLGLSTTIETRLAKLLAYAHTEFAPAHLEQIYLGGGPRIAPTSEIFFQGGEVRASGAFGAALAGTGIADFFGFRSSHATGVGCVVGALRRELVQISPRERSAWGRVAAHVDAALRLRHAGERSIAARFPVRGEAFEVTAAAESEVPRMQKGRDAIHRARSLRSKDGRAGLEAWRVLVDAKWSVVPSVDNAGREGAIVYENQPGRVEEPRLSELEGKVAKLIAIAQPNKLIAYELGIAEGTVATLVSRVRTKLGCKSRVELVRRCRMRGAASAPQSEAEPKVDPTRLAALTPAEREVVEWILRGVSVSSIASARKCSVRTVETLVSRAYRTLGVSSRAELARHFETPK